MIFICTLCENIKQDFERCVEELSNSYSSICASETANLGNILLAVKELNICRDKKSEIRNIPGLLNNKTAIFEELTDFMKDELHDVEKYYNKYIETKEPHYIKISKEELSHFQWFLSKLKSMVLSADEQNDLSYYLQRYNIWLTKLS